MQVRIFMNIIRETEPRQRLVTFVKYHWVDFPNKILITRCAFEIIGEIVRRFINLQYILKGLLNALSQQGE